MTVVCTWLESARDKAATQKRMSMELARFRKLVVGQGTLGTAILMPKQELGPEQDALRYHFTCW